MRRFTWWRRIFKHKGFREKHITCYYEDGTRSVLSLLVDKGPIAMEIWKICNSPVALLLRRRTLDFFFPVHLHKHPPSRSTGEIIRGGFVDIHRVRASDGLGLFESGVPLPSGGIKELGWYESTKEFETCDCRQSHPCLLHKDMRVLDCSFTESKRQARWSVLGLLNNWANGYRSDWKREA